MAGIETPRPHPDRYIEGQLRQIEATTDLAKLDSRFGDIVESPRDEFMSADELWEKLEEASGSSWSPITNVLYHRIKELEAMQSDGQITP